MSSYNNANKKRSADRTSATQTQDAAQPSATNAGNKKSTASSRSRTHKSSKDEKHPVRVQVRTDSYGQRVKFSDRDEDDYLLEVKNGGDCFVNSREKGPLYKRASAVVPEQQRRWLRERTRSRDGPGNKDDARLHEEEASEVDIPYPGEGDVEASYGGQGNPRGTTFDDLVKAGKIKKRKS
jgi:hypothetical protein